MKCLLLIIFAFFSLQPAISLACSEHKETKTTPHCKDMSSGTQSSSSSSQKDTETECPVCSTGLCLASNFVPEKAVFKAQVSESEDRVNAPDSVEIVEPFKYKNAQPLNTYQAPIAHLSPDYNWQAHFQVFLN